MRNVLLQLMIIASELEDVERTMFVKNASTQHKKNSDKGDAKTPKPRNDGGKTNHAARDGDKWETTKAKYLIR